MTDGNTELAGLGNGGKGPTMRLRPALAAVGACPLCLAPVAYGAVSAFRARWSSTHGITYAAGNATDSLFGTEAVTYAIRTAPTRTGSIQVTAKPVTTWTKTGTLSGTATSTLTVAANGKATFTNGKVSETKGTGTLKGHTITATFTGSGDTKTGTYQIKYKGTYK